MGMFYIRHPMVFIFLNLFYLSSHADDFNTRYKILTANFSGKGIDIIKFIRRFQNFIGVF